MANFVVKTIDNADVHGFESQNEDRPYTSLEFTKMFESLSLGGFAPAIGKQLKIIADPTNTGTDKRIILQTGAAIIGGHFVEIKEDITIDLAPIYAVNNNLKGTFICFRINRNPDQRLIQVIVHYTEQDDPWLELVNEKLTLNSGIWDFPIASILSQFSSSVKDNDIVNFLKSTNTLDPIQVYNGFNGDILRILIPNQDPINQNEEISLYLKFAPNFRDNNVSKISINNFKGTETELDIVDSNGNTLTYTDLKGKQLTATLDLKKGQCITRDLIGFSFDQGVVDERAFDFAGKTQQEVFDHFKKYPAGTKLLISTFDINSTNIHSKIFTNEVPYKTNNQLGKATFTSAEITTSTSSSVDINVITKFGDELHGILIRGEPFSTLELVYPIFESNNQAYVNKYYVDNKMDGN